MPSLLSSHLLVAHTRTTDIGEGQEACSGKRERESDRDIYTTDIGLQISARVRRHAQVSIIIDIIISLITDTIIKIIRGLSPLYTRSLLASVLGLF